MAILGEKFALVRERVDPMGVPTGVTVLAFKFKKKTDAVDMLQALQQSTLAVPVTHQVRTRQGHRLSYSVDGGDSNQSGSAGPRTVFDQPVSDVVVHKTTNMFTSDGAVADNRVLLRRLTEVTEQRDASEKGRIEAITRALMAEKEAASARREMADMRLEVSRVAADMATDMAQMKLDAVAETEQQVLSEVQKIKRGLELIDSRMMRRTQQPYTHPEKCTPAQFWADAEALHAEDPDQPPPEPRRASHAGSQNSSYLRLRRGDSESKLRASIAKNMEDDAKLEALPKEQLIAVVKVQRSRQQELSELPATVRMLEEDLAKAQASNDRLAKELVDMQSEFASKLAFLEAEKNLLADTIAGQEKATLNGSGGPSPLAALPESPQNGGKDGADSQAAAAGSPRRNGRASLGNDPLAEDTTEFELLEGVLSMVPEAEADNGYLVVAPEVRAEPAEAAPAPSAAPAVEVAVPTVVVHPASDADVSGPPAASPGQPAASFSANGPQPPMVEWVKVRADHPSGRGKELRVPAEAVAARPLDAFVELHKQDGAGLGFSIAGGVDDPVKPGMTGVFITSITPGGTADRSGCLSMGDCLLAVDGTSLENVLHDTAAKALQSTGVDVALTVRRFPEKEIFVEVEFVKGSQGLGFSISGGTDDPVREDDNCVYVTSIVPNGAADVDDRLRIGDKLLTVNGASMMSITHPAAVSLLQKVTHTITLVVARVPIMEDHTLASSTNITGQTAQNTTLGMSLSQPNATVPVVEDIIEVAFPRDPQTGAGIIVTGGKDHPVDQGDTAIYITRIVPGGAAERDGRLLPGDRIVEMDDVHLLSATTEGVAAAMVKPGDGIIKLTVTRLPHEQVEETLHIAFQKGPEGLGFTIAGGTGDVGDNGDAAIYVVKIIPGGVAEADGRLCKYDKIVQVNGQPMQNASHDQAVQALLSNPTGVDLVVSRLVDPSDTLNETGELVMSVVRSCSLPWPLCQCSVARWCGASWRCLCPCQPPSHTSPFAWSHSVPQRSLRRIRKRVLASPSPEDATTKSSLETPAFISQPLASEGPRSRTGG